MILTISVFVLYMCVELFGVRYNSADGDRTFFDIDYTTVMRGCCTIVVFVHIPSVYGNPIQDAIGSFGYICVTLFFLFSGYGLCWNIENRDGYMDYFLQKRLPALLVPYLISCMFKAVMGFGINSGGTAFVYALLFFYLSVYTIYRLYKKDDWINIVYVVVALYSLVGWFSGLGFGWYVESLGFAYGFMIAKYIERIKKYLEKGYLLRSSALTGLSLVCGILYVRYKYIWFLGDYVMRCILGGILIMWIVCITYRFRFGNNAALFLGHISYEVFLYHGLVMDILMRIDTHYGLGMTSGIYITLTISITILIASVARYVDDHAVERVRQLIVR